MSAINPHSENTAGFRLAVVVEGALGLAAVGLAKLFGVPLREQFAATPTGVVTGALLGVAATLPMLVMLWRLVDSRWAPLVKLRKLVSRMVHELFPQASIAELAIVALLAGMSEELLFRGVLQTCLGQWTTPLVGLIVASLVFGALHAVSRLYFILATLIGAYLGWLLLRFEDLMVPIVAHGLYDFIALVYLTRKQESEAS